jgi:hypothetical protein
LPANPRSEIGAGGLCPPQATISSVKCYDKLDVMFMGFIVFALIVENLRRII